MATIESALAAHRIWTSRFEIRILSGKPISFDPHKVRDAATCQLGHWLNSQSAIELLGPKAHQLICSLHDIFHELAYHASLMSADRAPLNDLREAVASLRNMSKQMALILEPHAQWGLYQ